MHQRMEKQLIKRLVSLALVAVMGLAPLLESTIVSANEPEKGQETQQQELEHRTVKATDIIKNISDADFAVETSMEGLDYDSEKETVTLLRIEGKEGSAFEPRTAGTYIASYLVVPKDQQESYVITRTITLTDTEGLAQIKNNGGNEKKADTKESDDSDEVVEPEIELTSKNKEDTEQTLAALEQEIENGEVLMFASANDISTRGGVHLEKGDTIYYPTNIGNYLTCWFYVNGKIAYCIESHKASPPSGDYVANVLDTNVNLQKVLYYGYGGAGDITGSYMPGYSEEVKYVFTHIAASYAYAGTDGFAGCSYENLVSSGVIGFIDTLFGMEEPPKGELSFSSQSLTTTRSGDTQRTTDVTLQGDKRNKVTLTLPSGITAVNKTQNTGAATGSLTLSGGDSFYLQAPLSMTGNFSTGNLYGSIRESWRTLVVTTGNAQQDIGVFESESASPVSLSVKWLDMARVSLKKLDAATKNPLKGAVYGIYKDNACTDLLLKMTPTNADGTCVSDYFDAGIKTVYVKELTAPQNYLRDDTVHKVDVKAGKTVGVTAEDVSVRGDIYVKKVDAQTGAFLPQGDAALEGAVYGLYAREDISHPDTYTGVLYPKGTLIAQKTIGKDGNLAFKGLYLGQMYIKEITPPTGYTLDPTEYDVTLTYEGQETELVTRELTVKEQVKKQAFSLIKVSEDGEQTETDLIEGAGFKVYLIRTLSKVKDGSLKPANGSAYTAEDFQNYDFSKEQVAVTYEHGQAVPVPELFTDKNGYLVSPELSFGSYVVEESTCPANLKKINPFVVKITEDSRKPMVWRIFDDRPFQFLLKIIKKDGVTGETVLGKQASYRIYDCEKEAYVEQTVYYPKKEKISIFTTTEEGDLLTPEQLKYGTYRIEEVKAPEGFVRQGYEMALQDGERVISPLEITQKGAYIKQPKEAITITVTSDTAYEVDSDSGVPVVTVEQKNEEQVGSLTLTKTGEQLQTIQGTNFLEQAKRWIVNLKEAVTGASFADTIFHAFQYADDGVEGAMFEVRAKETIVSPDGAVDEAGNPVIRYQKDDLVATLVTDKKGKAAVHNLPLGSYYMRETVAGEHFVLNPEEKEFRLSCKDDTAAVTYEAVAYKNERQKIAVEVEKQDSISKEPLSDVVFGLYTKEDIKGVNGKVLLEKNTLIEQKCTDEAGTLTFASDLYHGNYYVKELKQKPGYIPNKEVWEIQVPYDNQKESRITCKKIWENQPTETQFVKTDLVTGEPVLGAKVQVLDKNKTVLEEWVTGKEKHIIYGLPEGDYLFHEELPPYAEGYVTAQDVPFTVKADGSIAKVEMKEAVSKVEISKTDAKTGTELIGATLQVLDKEENILKEWVSDGTPLKIERLPVGVELILRELSAPKGYTIAEDVLFTVEDTEELQTIEMKDDYIYGKVRIEKVDSETKKPLAGAVFEVRNKTTGNVETTLTTDENGMAESEKLLLGTYAAEGIEALFSFVCVETKAPEGYELDEREFPVQFSLEGQSEPVITVTVLITNQKLLEPAATIKTGDATNIIGFLGLLGASVVLIIMVIWRRKKYNQNRIES